MVPSKVKARGVLRAASTTSRAGYAFHGATGLPNTSADLLSTDIRAWALIYYGSRPYQEARDRRVEYSRAVAYLPKVRYILNGSSRIVSRIQMKRPSLALEAFPYKAGGRRSLALDRGGALPYPCHAWGMYGADAYQLKWSRSRPGGIDN